MHWERLPTIEASRVSLRWISEGDVDAFYAIYSNSEVMRYWSTPPLADREAAANLIKKIQEDWKRRVILKWGVALRADDQLIGSITLFNLDFNHRRAEIGYALGRDHWGQGSMKGLSRKNFSQAGRLVVISSGRLAPQHSRSCSSLTHTPLGRPSGYAFVILDFNSLERGQTKLPTMVLFETPARRAGHYDYLWLCVGAYSSDWSSDF